MGSTARFFLALTVAVITLTGGSLLWPKLTIRPRPDLLEKIHDAVLGTQAGRQYADVLGVSDEANVVPINMSEVVSSAVVGVKTGIQNRVQKVVIGNAVNALRDRFDSLPQEQKNEVRQILCEPQDP